MPKNTILIVAAFVNMLALTLAISSCKQQNRAQKMPESVNAYVYGYTSGTISKTSDIRVRFASATASEEEVGLEVNKKVISFSPSLDGTAYWDDEQTLRFKPSSPMTSGQTYVATVALDALFDNLPADAKSFEFDYKIRDQYLQIEVEGIHAVDQQKLEEQLIKGYAYTADWASAEDIALTFEANQGRRSLPVKWGQSEDGLKHEFTIEEVARSNEASEVTLNWNGQAIGVNLKGNNTIQVPALNDFRVVNAKVVTGESMYFLLHFSDPLDEEQTFDGLIQISGYGDEFRYLAEGNQLRLYPNARISGKHTIQVSPGIKNSLGKRMQNASQWDIVIEDIQPQVRLVGSGVIMPESDGLIFPFDAVSLNAVEVEIFKIYHNNILQFLQSNQIDGYYDLQRVGRVVKQKKIPLHNLNPNANTSSWTRYALDLSTLIAEDPKAIYQVRIGFRPEYSTYFCSTNTADSNTSNDLTTTEADGEIKSFMDNWYGFDGYYSGYSYQHRSNPCYPAYYNSDRFIQRNVIASNLGIIAKGGEANQYFVAVTDLRTAEPVSGVTVEFYDYQQQLLHSQTADDEGRVTAELDRNPFVVLAKNNEERGYLRLRDGDALSLSRFDVSGARTQKGLKGYLYGERGVWRPGDSVYLNFILEDKSAQLPPNYPIQFELKDPRGQLQIKRSSSANTNKVYPLHFATGLDAPTGSWSAIVRAGGAVFSKNIRVETVKPNRIKVDLDFGKPSLSVKDEPLQATLNASWLHGAPAANLKAKVEAQLSSAPTTFKGYDNYAFTDPARRFSSEPITVFDGTLDGNGQQNLSIRLNKGAKVPGKLKANFKTRVFEKGGDFSTDNVSIPYDPYAAYAGIQLPTGKYNQKRIDVDKSGRLAFVALSGDGKAIANRKLSVGVYRVNWRWWWDRGSDNVSRYNSSNHLDAKNSKVVTTDSKGNASWDYKVEEWGRYLVRVCDTETGHCAGDYFYAGYPWYGEGNNDEARKAAAILAFSSDKESYDVGETVSLKLPDGKIGKALITIENGREVVESFWVDAKEGDNTFTFEATEGMAPNVYAHIAMIQPHAQVANDLPIRMYGVIPIMVEDPATRLIPKIEMPDELKPKEKFAITVSETSGKPMAYTVAIVDEGLLGLTRFKTPDPWSSFYAREALGVKTWDIYDHVLGAYGAELERLLSIGGDGAIKRAAQEDRANRFKPVVMHLGPMTLKAGQKARHEFVMPNYVGAVRVMVVAADNDAYGNAEKTVPVKQPLMVLSTLPRVLSPGEQFQLPVNVFAMDKKVRNVTVEVKEQSGLVTVIESRRPDLSFSKPGDQMVSFPVEVNDRVGVARFTITASGNGEKASQEIEVQVRNPNPYITDVDGKVIDPGQQYQFDYVPPGMAGTNEVILEVSSIPPLNLGDRMDYLIRYPYGCLEQTLSSGFPQLYARQLLELSDEQKEVIPEHIEATINRLKRFQTANGGFAYWPGGDTPSHWASSYAGHFLLEAKDLGYNVPPSLLNKWIQFQKKVAKMWNPKSEAQAYGFYSHYDDRGLMQSYRLFTLALAREADLPAMNRLREYDKLNTQAKWRLAAAYALAGKTEVAQDMIQNLSTDIKDYRELGYTYGSRLRDRSMFLEAIVIMGDRDKAAPIIQYISDEMSSQRWLSTQETSFALLAIGKFLGGDDARSKMQFSYQVPNAKWVNAGSELPVMQIAIPAEAGTSQTLVIKNTGEGVLFTRVIRTGQPVAGEETASANDMAMTVQYEDMNGVRINPAVIAQGTDFIAEVRISHPGTRPMPYEELALSQVFPSGWEIINTRMDNLPTNNKSSKPEYQDIRDDRVNTFFDLKEGNTDTYRIQLNAAYQGRFYLPAVSCEAMYDNSINARAAGQWVEVTVPRGI
jgi:uncharacterized protein YfaS (alpha-2-macroglobulin family)